MEAKERAEKANLTTVLAWIERIDALILTASGGGLHFVGVNEVPYQIIDALVEHYTLSDDLCDLEVYW